MHTYNYAHTYIEWVINTWLPQTSDTNLTPKTYRIAGFCHEDFNIVSHGIRNIKIRHIFIS